MVIVYNPASGTTISEKFRDTNGFSLAKALQPNSTQYCEPAFAQSLIATYPFLQILTAEQVKELKKETKKEEPVLEISEEVDPDIPVVETVKTDPKVMVTPTEEIPDDLKGVDWYGEGVKETHE